MKVTDLRRRIAQAMVAGGIWFSSTAALAQINHAVGDASFDDMFVDAKLGYAYFDGPPDTAWESTGNWWYNSTYDSGRRPTPRTGDQAIHGGGDYNWQVLSDTFVEGRTYNFSIYTQGDSDSTGSGLGGTDRVWLYFFDGATAVPDPVGGFFDTDSLYAASFEQDGVAGTPITGVGFSDDFSGFNRSGDSDWTRIGVNYTATAAVDGNPIGIAFYGRADAAFDDAALVSDTNVFLPLLNVEISRDSGDIVMTNNTGAPVNISGYSFTSAFEGLDPDNWLSIAENYDADDSGEVDPDNEWTELTAADAHGDLSEGDLDSALGTTLAQGQSVTLSNGPAWIQNPNEDVIFQYISEGVVKTGLLAYAGNDGDAFANADLDVDGDIDADDWGILRSNQHTDLSGLSLAEAYRRGDLTGDGENNHPDFVEFKEIFDATNGQGAFAAMLAAVPEPSATTIILVGGMVVAAGSRRRASSTSTAVRV